MMLPKLWTGNLRYKWSQIRHCNSIKTTNYRSDLYPERFRHISNTAKELMARFEYRKDNITELYDSMDNPAELWEKAFKNPPLKDDCDGFHGALYWAVSQKFDCALITLITHNIIDSHTCLYINHNGLNYYAEYDFLSWPFTKMNLLTESIRKRRGMAEVAYHEMSKWNGKKWEKYQ